MSTAADADVPPELLDKGHPTKTAAEPLESKNEKAPRRSSAGQVHTLCSAVGTTRIRYTADALRGR